MREGTNRPYEGIHHTSGGRIRPRNIIRDTYGAPNSGQSQQLEYQAHEEYMQRTHEANLREQRRRAAVEAQVAQEAQQQGLGPPIIINSAPQEYITPGHIRQENQAEYGSTIAQEIEQATHVQRRIEARIADHQERQARISQEIDRAREAQRVGQNRYAQRPEQERIRQAWQEWYNDITAGIAARQERQARIAQKIEHDRMELEQTRARIAEREQQRRAVAEREQHLRDIDAWGREIIPREVERYTREQIDDFARRLENRSGNPYEAFPLGIRPNAAAPLGAPLPDIGPNAVVPFGALPPDIGPNAVVPYDRSRARHHTGLR